MGAWRFGEGDGGVEGYLAGYYCGVVVASMEGVERTLCCTYVELSCVLGCRPILLGVGTLLERNQNTR